MGFLNIFKKREKLPPLDFSWLAVDMHSHLIPGIDDGSQSLVDTIGLLAKFQEMGYSKVITTPHVMSDSFRNTPEIINQGLEKVKEAIKNSAIKIEVEAAAEYYYDEGFLQLIKEKNILTFGESYVLFEFAFLNEPSNTEGLFFELLSSGYKPILAHFERYVYWHGSIEKARELRNKGIYIQLNLNSLMGHYGPEVKKQAELLVDNELVDFVGSDCHRIQHLLKMEQAAHLDYASKLMQLPIKNSSLN